MDKVTSTADFCFHFEGVSSHEINIDTLAKGLAAVNQFVIATQAECFPAAEINLNVTATKRGSFIVVLQMAAAVGITLMEPGNLEYATNLVSVLMGMVDLKKFLSDKSAKEVQQGNNSVIVTNGNGEVKEFRPEVKQYFNGATIENSIINIIQVADSNTDVDGFSLSSSSGDKTSIYRDSFEELETPVVEIPEELTDRLNSTVVASVRRSDCYGDLQWEFQTDRVFRAKITDEGWLEKYNNGDYRMYPHVRLKMDLLSIVQLDKNGGLLPGGKTKYEVTKVHEVIYPGEYTQTSF